MTYENQRMVISLSMTALSRGPEGVYALAVTAAPVGYHPSTKYWRTKATAPATTGVDMLVPLSVPSAQFWLLVLLQTHQEQSDMRYRLLRLKERPGAFMVSLRMCSVKVCTGCHQCHG